MKEGPDQTMASRAFPASFQAWKVRTKTQLKVVQSLFAGDSAGLEYTPHYTLPLIPFLSRSIRLYERRVNRTHTLRKIKTDLKTIFKTIFEKLFKNIFQKDIFL